MYPAEVVRASILIPNVQKNQYMKMWKSKLMLAGAIGMVLTFSSCSKDPLTNLTEEESRIYITDYDSSARFSNYKTFSISDSVAVINNGQVSKQSTATDQAFISAVKSQMQAKGFTLVNKNSKPDLGVNVNRIYNTSTGVITYDNYWDYYGGYWDPYYWGYPSYNYYVPYSYAVYNVREGALSIDMLDLKDAGATNNIRLVWTGLIRGSGIFNSQTAASQVGMLFSQSPYLTSK